MGYTNYFEIKSNAKQNAYNRSKAQISDLVKFAMDQGYVLVDGNGDADSKPYLTVSGELAFNGAGEDGHESFYLPKKINRNNYDFVKTNRKDYDAVVMASMLAMKFQMNDTIQVTSDGFGWTDYKDTGWYVDESFKVAVKLFLDHLKHSNVVKDAQEYYDAFKEIIILLVKDTKHVDKFDTLQPLLTSMIKEME